MFPQTVFAGQSQSDLFILSRLTGSAGKYLSYIGRNPEKVKLRTHQCILTVTAPIQSVAISLLFKQLGLDHFFLTRLLFCLVMSKSQRQHILSYFFSDEPSVLFLNPGVGRPPIFLPGVVYSVIMDFRILSAYVRLDE